MTMVLDDSVEQKPCRDFLQFGKRKGLSVRDVEFSWGMFLCLLPLFASMSTFVALPTIAFIVLLLLLLKPLKLCDRRKPQHFPHKS